MSYENYGQNAPYHDDFDETQNFLRVLFNPSRAVQARELTQLQTILQNQLGSIAGHILRENTSVFQANISISDKKPTARIRQLALMYNPLEPVVEDRWSEDGVTVHSLTPSWIGKTFQNTDPNDTTKTPTKTLTITDYKVNPGENPILYYEYSGEDALDNERFYDSVNQGTSVGGITLFGNPYRSLVASNDSGIIWTRGHFVVVNPQQLVISDTPDVGEFQIGFEVMEDIVTSTDSVVGNTLLDPANGSYNFNAPGADRYRITARLSAYNTADEAGLPDSYKDSFVPFAIVRDGALVGDVHVTEYSDILDLLARRTYDESGSYSVRDFSLTLKEASVALQPRAGQAAVVLEDYVGFIPGKTDINDYLTADLGPGKAYVLGYEVDKSQSTQILIYKGRNVQSVNNKIVNLTPTFSFIAKNVDAAGAVAQPDGNGYGAQDFLHFQRMEEVEIMSGLNGSGRVLTKARIAGLDRRGAALRVHLMDSNDPGASTAATGSTGVATTALQKNAVAPINFKNINAARSIRRVGDSDVNLNIGLDATDPKNITPLFSGYPVPQIFRIPGIATLKDHNVAIDALVVQSYTVTLDGSENATITASTSSVVFEDQAEDVVVYAFNRTTDTPLDASKITATPSSNTLALGFSGVAGVSPGDQIVMSVKARHPQANARTKTKQTKTITVAIDSPAKDVVILPDEDVIKITSIKQTTNIKTGLADDEGKRALSEADLLALRFDNGQRDYFYDKGSVSGWSALFNSYKETIKASGAYVPTTYEIVYEYYEHEISNNKFFFTLKSYSDITDENDYVNFPVYRSASFGDFDLMNMVDFRRKISEMDSGSNNIPFAASYDEIVIDDITHYVGRYVNIWVDKDSRFGVTNGVASTSPEKPGNVPGVMNLYTLFVPPYTFNKNEVSITGEKNLRYTMQDIRGLEKRIERLEEYVSLTMLEKNAYDLEVIDPVTGLDRFKSGIFVDPFADHRYGDSKNPDYRVTINSTESAIQCPIDMFSFEMNLVLSQTTAAIHKNLVTLPVASSKTLVENLIANSTANLNPTVYYVWKGSLTLTPSSDTWFDTRYLAERHITADGFEPPSGFTPVPRADEIKRTWTGINKNDLEIADTLGATPVVVEITNSSSKVNDFAPSAPANRPVGIRGNERVLPLPADVGVTDTTAVLKAMTGSARTLDVNVTGTATDPNSPLASYNTIARNPNSDKDIEISSRTKIISPPKTGNSDEKKVDNRMIDWTQSPYIRPRWVRFDAKGLRAGVEVQLQFDGKTLPTSLFGGENEVDLIALAPDGKDKIVDLTLFGREYKSLQLKTDNKGEVSGYFYIPPNTFTCGVKSVVVTDSQGTSSANTTYTARGNILTKNKTITAIRTVERRESMTAQDDSRRRKNPTNQPVTEPIVGGVGDVSIPPPISLAPVIDIPKPGSGSIREDVLQRPGEIDRAPRWVDPIAQAFKVNVEGGCFIRSITIFTATKPGDFDSNTRLIDGVPMRTKLQQLYPNHPVDYGVKERPLSFYIVEMENGKPTANIVPLSQHDVKPASLNSHPMIPSQAGTVIQLNDPVYLESGTEYALVLYSSSKEYNVWTANLGEIDYFENGPYLTVGKSAARSRIYTGAHFRGRNNSEWEESGKSSLTFKIDICQFAPSATVVMSDKKFVEDSRYGGRVMKIWNMREEYQKGDIVAFPVPDTFDAGHARVKLFENKTDGPIAPEVFPVDRRTLIVGPGWSVVTDDAYDENRDKSRRYGHSVYPIVGEMLMNGTTATYDHNFVSGPSNGTFTMPSEWFPVKNQDENIVGHLGNGADLNGERLVDNAPSGSKSNYAMRAHLRTNNPNLTPVLDKEQMRAVMIENLVVGVERNMFWGGKSFSQVQTTFENSGYDVAYDLGKFVKNQSYSKNHVVFLADDPDTFYVYNGTTPKTYANGLTNDQLITEFVNDLNNGLWYKDAEFSPPFINGQTGVGDCGTYISKTINLANPADDLKMILDIKTPGNSFVNALYRFQKDAPQFMFSIPYDDSMGVNLSDFVGKKVKVKYRGAAGNVNALSSVNPQTGTVSNQLIVNGIEEYVVTGQPLRYRVFVSSVSEENAFPEGVTFDGNGHVNGSVPFTGAFANVNNVILIPDEINDLERIEESDPSPSLQEWNAGSSYVPGSVVITQVSGAAINDKRNFRVWRSRSYIGTEWASGTAYTTGQIVLYRASSGNPFIAYRALANNTNQNPSTSSANWLPLLQSNGQPFPAFGVGTRPSELGTAWQQIPALAIHSEVKEEENVNDWRPMVADANINTASLDDDKYFEWTFTPKVKPEVEFKSFQVRIDMRNVGFDRVNIPMCRNLRVIAVY